MADRDEQTRVLLLVEDNPGDATLVREMLDGSGTDYQVVHVQRMTHALDELRDNEVDVVVLDLRLPDCAGVDSVKAIHDAAKGAPIVVLTGSDDERLALACIEAGAQDYLAKHETQARNLCRSIGYAISRTRERKIHELQSTLERYRAMSSSGQLTTVTAAMARSGAISLRESAEFARLLGDYFRLLEPYVSGSSDRVDPPRQDMERIVTALGDHGGGPRDLLDLHVAALDSAIALEDASRSLSTVFEARLLALEMMGLLVDYYRVGFRRRFTEGAST